MILLLALALGVLGILAVVALSVVFGGEDAALLVLRAGLLLTILSVVVLSLTWLERKALGRIQQRIGPMRVGPFGVLQPVADAIKLVVKEDIMPSWVDRPIYWLAPLVVFVPSFLVWVVVPFSGDLVLRDLDLGVLYVLAMQGLTIIGLIMAGWGSANKYGIMGGLRSAAQLISYEIPLLVIAMTVAMLAGTLNLTAISEGQGYQWYILLQPMAFFVFLLAGLAEVGRSPFDIFQAESELVGGPFIEYSGAHWSIFFLAEYMNTFLIAALVTIFFLGGWSGPFLPEVAWFLIKCYAVILLIFWLRGTLPRLRIDQLMAFGWQALVPLSFLNFILVSAVMFYGWPVWVHTGLGLVTLAGAAVFIYTRQASQKARPRVRLVSAREVRRV
ncbi:MAG: NADH-quinone oxidoreductase subunit NuoH [Chloroflexota bacterium]|nr:NADH-quinone oxidoreductase subunit NuoH [Chloroflexota bacterium]MDE2970303.1 NADH-quinone oxidoreductase subunit NuoH [Chloroflexota bacterium]